MRILTCTLLFVSCGYALQPLPSCDGTPNLSPLLTPTVTPLNSVPNGDSYLLANDTTNYVYLAKVRGTAYEMGYAQGQLFKNELQQQILNLEAIYPENVRDALDTFGIPKSVVQMMPDWLVTQVGEVVLDVNWIVASQWIPQRYADEMRGIADASGIAYERIRRANLLPELIQAHCTVLGAWGNATSDGKLYHLRALDWDAFAPINQYPIIVIYEPSEEGSQVFANINYLGWIGTLTSISKIGISVGEKVMLPRVGSSDYPIWPTVTYFGKPWQFTLRDTIQFATSLADVSSLLTATHRTMRIHGGWGSAPDHSFRGMNFASNFVELFDDKNYTHNNEVSHPQMDGVFYFDKHVQPSGDQCVKNIITPFYEGGSINEETMYRDIVGGHQTGDNMYVVMKPETGEIWMASSEYGKPVKAYQRSPLYINLSNFW